MISLVDSVKSKFDEINVFLAGVGEYSDTENDPVLINEIRETCDADEQKLFFDSIFNVFITTSHIYHLLAEELGELDRINELNEFTKDQAKSKDTNDKIETLTKLLEGLKDELSDRKE